MKLKERKVDNNEILWNSDTIYALGFYKRISGALGFWPIKSRKASATRVGIISFIQLSLIVIFVNDAFTHGICGTITEIIDAITLVICTSLAILKIIETWRHREKIQIIMNSAIEDWFTVVDEKTRKLMMSYAYTGRMVVIFVMFGSYMTIIPMILIGIPGIVHASQDAIENNSLFRTIPIVPRCWIPVTMSFHLYIAYYISVSLHIIILATAYNGVDAFIFGIAMHICGQFELLYNSIPIGNYYEKLIQQPTMIRMLSKRHNHLLMIAKLLESTCNSIIFCEVAADIILICISGIALLTALQTNDNGTIFSIIMRLFVLYIQLFMYSYLGENLSSQAESLRTAVYNCPWFEMSPRTVRDLQLIMMRCNDSFYLTAGKMYVMNLSNFKDLVKSMFSFFSLIRIMFEN